LPGVADAISYPALFLLREFSQKDFWDAIGNFDPLPYWREMNIPTLVLYGSEDTNVPTEASRARLESMGKENIAVKIYPGSGHALQDPPGSGDSIFRDEALMDIIDFIQP
jgi:pimeloyl-ACP methyl ester carboxylesterase